MKPNYKILCINLERRTDRRQKMTEKFKKSNLDSYHFFNAIDGHNMNPSNSLLKYFKFEYNSLLKKGAVGCALSHFLIWQKLISESDCNHYVILEDDIDIGPNFKVLLENYINKIRDFMHVVFIGSTTEKKDYEVTRKIYQYDTTYNIYPLTQQYYAGGAFGYIISKTCAKKLVEHIEYSGIRMNIDYLIFRAGINKFETHPHIVFTNAVQHNDTFVDSDIQYEQNKIEIAKSPNNYQFDDYDFYPNQDSTGGDITQTFMDIEHLKNMADNNTECIAFNTYGWIKKFLVPFENLVVVPNLYHEPDGLYIKKKYNTIEFRKKKIYLQKKSKLLPINIYIGPNALSKNQNLIKIILEKFPVNQFSQIPYCDVCINHWTDTVHSNNKVSLNILISDTFENIPQVYDIEISENVKLQYNSIHTIYYPVTTEKHIPDEILRKKLDNILDNN